MLTKATDRVESIALRQSSKGGKGARGRGGRGQGRGGASGGRAREVGLSKELSRLLRHQAASVGIQLDKEGFAPLDRVLQWGPIRTISPTFAEIQTTVNESDKQRFALRPNPATNPALDANTTDPAHWMIRANQGHSIKLESEGLLQPFILPSEDPTATAAPAGVPVPPTVVHGTYFCFWPAIVASGGLKPMGRNHVHCSTGLPPTAGRGGDDSGGASEVVSGMRRDAELLVYVDVERSMREAGLKWWKSDNGVVLTEGDENGLVPARFFREVVGRKQEVVGVLWKYGEKVADLPDELNMKVPKGKRRVTGSGNRGGVGGSGSRGRSKGIFRDGSRKHMES